MALTHHLAAAADHGATADWVAALAALVAAVGTVGTLIWQARALNRERATRREELARLRAEQREVEEAQARTVVLHNAACDGVQWSIIQNYKVAIGNYGTQPITNIVATLTYSETQTTYKVGPPPLPVLRAGAHHGLTWRLVGHPWPSGWNAEDLPNAFKCEVEFTDVHGVRWVVQPGLGQQPSRVYQP